MKLIARAPTSQNNQIITLLSALKYFNNVQLGKVYFTYRHTTRALLSSPLKVI